MTDAAARYPPAPFEALLATLLIDAETGRFVAANPSAEMLLGYSAAALSALSPADIHPHELARLQAFLNDVRAAGSWTADDLSCRTATGETIPALVRARTIAHEGRERILVVQRDRR